MRDGSELYQNYHIIFTGNSSEHWLVSRLDPYFKHCYAVKESAGGAFWIIVDSKNCYVDVSIESKINYPTIRDLCVDCTIVPIRAKIDLEQDRHTLCVYNCVEQCKALIGVRSFWTWTPYQLYKLLTEDRSCQEDLQQSEAQDDKSDPCRINNVRKIYAWVKLMMRLHVESWLLRRKVQDADH